MNARRLVLVFAIPLGLLLSSAALAAPGPGGGAEEQVYNVLIYQSGGQQYGGQYIFSGDPERPQRFEVGALEVLLADPNNEANPGAAGLGTWISLDFFFVDFWLALANTDGGGNVFVFGIAFSDEIFGKAFLLSDPNLTTGRYKITGEVGEAVPPDDGMGDGMTGDDATSPPVLDAIGAQTAIVDQELTVNVSATDADDGATLTFAIDPTTSPAGATIDTVDNNNATVRWTPTAAGDFSIRVIVTDSAANTDSETFTVTVSAN